MKFRHRFNSYMCLFSVDLSSIVTEHCSVRSYLTIYNFNDIAIRSYTRFTVTHILFISDSSHLSNEASVT